jgi:DNA-binding GntR family transcriptional regulator
MARLPGSPDRSSQVVLASLADRPRLGEEVTRALREAIMTGLFRPGDRLAVEALAGQFGVSAMPVREALVVLASEGIVDGVAHRGFRVAQIRRRDFEDAFNVHAHVAGLLAAAAAEQITNPELEVLRSFQQQIVDVSTRTAATPDPTAAQKVAELNYAFHRSINRIPDADRLRWFLRAATRYIPRRFYDEIPGWLDATVAEHPALLDALERHDSAAAQALTVAHVSRAGELVVAHLAKIGYWADRP